MSQPVLEMAATFAAALGPVLLRPAPRKRMVVPLTERPPMVPRARVAPTVAEGITVTTLAPRPEIVRPANVSSVAVVAAVASRTSSPPARVSGRVDPMRFAVFAPLTTVSLPLERSVIAPVPPKATPLTKVLPARISIVPVISGLAVLKLTVPVPNWVKPPVLLTAPVPTVMTVPTPRAAVLAALRVKLVPAVMAVMVAPAGMLVPDTGMPTYQPAVVPV